jgi:xanthine dehydrogenase accessory factor
MWCEVISSGKNSYLLTSIKNTEGQIKITGRSILFPDGHTAGANILSIAEIENIRTEIHNISNTSIFDFPDKQVIVDAVRRLKTMYCFGAGHVAVPTARIAAMTGFRVVVIDDRAEFACAERFSEADEVRVIEKFECAFDRLKIDADSFIVIATRGHMFDKVVLEQALQTRAGYIGMISSRKKLSSIYEALMAGGASKESLERVHSPIGIKIGGDTPEEIAVSIIAELISERSRQQGSG